MDTIAPPDAAAINAQCVCAHLHGMGLGPAPDLALLRRCSLMELVAARDATLAANAAATAAGRPITIAVTCADRFLAALYAALHYDPSAADEPDPMVLLDQGGERTVLVHVVVSENG